MTPDKLELYARTKERLRELGIENPADVIVHLAEEIKNVRVDTAREIFGMLREDLKGEVDMEYLERLLTIYEKKYTESEKE